MKKYLKRIFKKFKIRFSTMGRSSLRTNSPEDIEPYEKTAFKICVKVISHPESEFMIAPMSNKRYIINQELSLFVIIDYGRVEIINHIFDFDVNLSRRDFERITYLYDTETEKRRTATEDEVKGNIKNSLVKVYEKISAK
jgi:hypothetical protein